MSVLSDASNADIVGVLVLSVTYGFYLLLFTLCTMALYKRDRRIYSWLLIANTVLFTLTSMHAIGVMVRLYLRQSKDSHQNGEYDTHPTRESSILSGINNLSYFIAMLLEDIIMIYRAYVVWARRVLIVVIPLALWLASIATASVTIDLLVGKRAADHPALQEIRNMVAASLLTSFAVNLSCSSLIAWGIYRNTSPLLAYGGKSPRVAKVSEYVMQSAGVNCAFQLVIIVSLFVGSNLSTVILDFYPTISAIVFSLLFIRASENPLCPTTPTLRVGTLSTFTAADGCAGPSLSTDDDTTQASGDGLLRLDNVGVRRTGSSAIV